MAGAVATLSAVLIFASSSPLSARELPIERLRLPPGFSVEVWARVPDARALALGKHNVMVGSRSGAVHAVSFGADLRATRIRRLATGLSIPLGVATHRGDLYVSSVDRILVWRNIEAHLDAPGEPDTIVADLPAARHHGGRYLRFGPDGLLYVSVGAPCNVCAPDGDRHSVILRMRADGSRRETVARGVRNSVGFDWHPDTGELWFTDNGRDWLGDDAPACELNRLSHPGQHFGFPYCHGGDLADPEFGRPGICGEYVAPARKLGAHVAPLGMRFYVGEQFPEDYRNAVLIAEHGSWNRSRKIGYRISLVRTLPGQPPRYQTFIDGWLLPDESVWGRPADLLVMPDGSVLISDDHAGAIYRVRYAAPRQP